MHFNFQIRSVAWTTWGFTAVDWCQFTGRPMILGGRRSTMALRTKVALTTLAFGKVKLCELRAPAVWTERE